MTKLSRADLDGIGSFALSLPSVPASAGIDPTLLSRIDAWLHSPGMKGALVVAAGSGASHPMAAVAEWCRGLFTLFMQSPIPLCAVIDNDAFGPLFELALACHWRFAAAAARVGFPEGLRSLIEPPDILGRNLGTRGNLRLSSLIAESTPIDGESARTGGLVTAVAGPEGPEACGREFLRSLVAKRSVALVRVVMQATGSAASLPRADALEKESSLFHNLVRQAASPAPENHESIRE